MLQNHLTEMAALIAMDLPDEKSLTDSREIIQSKISILQHVSHQQSMMQYWDNTMDIVHIL